MPTMLNQTALPCHWPTMPMTRAAACGALSTYGPATWTRWRCFSFARWAALATWAACIGWALTHLRCALHACCCASRDSVGQALAWMSSTWASAWPRTATAKRRRGRSGGEAYRPSLLLSNPAASNSATTGACWKIFNSMRTDFVEDSFDANDRPSRRNRMVESWLSGLTKVHSCGGLSSNLTCSLHPSVIPHCSCPRSMAMMASMPCRGWRLTINVADCIPWYGKLKPNRLDDSSAACSTSDPLIPSVDVVYRHDSLCVSTGRGVAGAETGAWPVDGFVAVCGFCPVRGDPMNMTNGMATTVARMMAVPHPKVRAGFFTGTPQCGQLVAWLLMSLPHSLHLIIAMRGALDAWRQWRRKRSTTTPATPRAAMAVITTGNTVSALPCVISTSVSRAHAAISVRVMCIAKRCHN